MAERAGISQRAMFIAILGATILGSVLGHLVRIYLGYRWVPPNAAGETTSVVPGTRSAPSW